MVNFRVKGLQEETPEFEGIVNDFETFLETIGCGGYVLNFKED